MSNVLITLTWRRLREYLLPWTKNIVNIVNIVKNKYNLLVCVCMCAGACVWVPGRVGVCLRISALSFLIQHVTRMRHIVKLFVATRSPPHFFRNYLINGAIFGKELLNIKCLFSYSLQHLSRTFPILRRI
jgi:hypothetical protein